jgi:hypothetical protein
MDMSINQSRSITPGEYQFKPLSFAPWVHVKVFRESVANKDNLKVKLAGLEFPAEKFLHRGQWKAI